MLFQVKEFTCTVGKRCKRIFLTEKGLNQHIESKHNEYKCQFCQQTCSSYKSLKRHLRVEHPKNDPNEFVCQICGVNFLRNGRLLSHVASEHMPVNCSKCGQDFVNGKDCRVHRKTCLKEKEDAVN